MRQGPSRTALARWAATLAFACCAWARLFGAQGSSPPAGQISGHVYRADTGEPIAKAVVDLIPRSIEVVTGVRGARVAETVAPRQPEARAVLSFADGSFTFNDVIPGDYILRAQHAGFVAETYGQQRGHGAEILELASAQSMTGVDFRLTAAGVISGAVVDADGEPVEGLEVSAVQARFLPGGRLEPNVAANATTDDRGSFRLFNLRPASYFLRVGGSEGLPAERAVGYRETFYPGGVYSLSDAQPIPVAAGAEVGAIRLAVVAEPTHNISGTVADAGDTAGRRRYFVEVIAGESRVRTQVRQEGSFIFRGIAAGDYLLLATAIDSGGNGGPAARGFAKVQVADSDAHVTIEIGRTGEVRGNVMEASGQTAIFVTRRLLLQASDQQGSGTALARGGGAFNYSTPPLDSSGAFDFQQVAPGSYSFSLTGGDNTYVQQASCAGQDFTLRPIVVDSSSLLDHCQVVLGSDTGSVAGQVTDGNAGVAGQVVVLIPESRDLRQVARYTQTATSDSRGQFALAGVVPGDYMLFAVAPFDDQRYFAMDFAERNQHDATRVHLQPNQSQTVTLRAISQQPQ